MATVKLGPAILDARGKIAGVVFSKNKSSHYIRASKKPVNPRGVNSKFARDPENDGQSFIQAALAQLTVRWSQTVTALQRTGWEVYASNVTMLNKLGESITLSGFNHYIRSNVIAFSSYGVAYDAPPTIFELAEQDPAVRVEPDATTQQVALIFDDTMEWVDENGATLWIWEGMPQNPQRTFFGGPYLGLKDKAGSSGSPKSSPESFSTIHTVSEGQRVWYRFRIQRADGRISEPFYANNLVVAS